MASNGEELDEIFSEMEKASSQATEPDGQTFHTDEEPLDAIVLDDDVPEEDTP